MSDKKTSYRIVFTSPPQGVTWFFNPSNDDCGGQVVINNIKGNIVLPLGSNFDEGWNLHIRQEVGPGGAIIAVQHPDTIAGQMGSDSSVHTGEGLSEIVRGGPNMRGGFTYVVSGDIFNTGKAEA